MAEYSYSDKEIFQKYHYNAYQNLVRTLFGLNVSGIAGIIAYMGIVLNQKCCTSKLLIDFKFSFECFLVGLFFIVFEILIEYSGYFAYILNSDKMDERDKIFQKELSKVSKNRKSKINNFFCKIKILFKYKLGIIKTAQLFLMAVSFLALCVGVYKGFYIVMRLKGSCPN